MEAKPANVDRALLALYVMNFLTSAGFGVFGVVMTLYMHSVGVDLVGLGVVFSVFGLVMGIAGIFFGAHSDVVGRKPYLVLSLLLRGFVTFFYTQATNVVVFVVLQALIGVSNALSGATVSALMTDLTKDSERGRKFGRMGGFGWLGTGLGYFVGGAFSQFFGFQASFIFVSILTFISFFLVLGFVPSYRIAAEKRFSLALVKGFSPNFKIWLIVSFATALVIGPVEAMVIPFYVSDPSGPLKIDIVIFGSFMAASYILSSSTQFIGGYLADKYNRRKIASLFYLMAAPFVLVQPFYLSFIFFASMYAFEGIGEGLGQPCNNAIVASAVRPKNRGSDFSIINFLGNIGSTIGFIWMGILLSTVGSVFPFVIRALVYVGVATLIYFKLKD